MYYFVALEGIFSKFKINEEWVDYLIRNRTILLEWVRYNLIGYRKGEDGQPEIVPEEAKYVKDVFDMYLDGNSVDQIKEYNH